MIPAVKSTKVERAEELIALLRPHEDRWQPYPTEWVFRGQWNAKFELLPTAYRANEWKPFTVVGDNPFDPMGGYQSEIVQAQHEYRVLKRFLDDTDRAALGAPNEVFVRVGFEEANRNDLEFILEPALSTFAALAQHHALRSHVQNGRVVIDEPVDLHEGTALEVDVYPMDAHNGIAPEERRRVLQAIDEGLAAAGRDEHVDADEFVNELLAEP